MTSKRSLYAGQMHPRRIQKSIAHRQATGAAVSLRALNAHSLDERRVPRPITLPKLKFLEMSDDDDRGEL